MFLIALGGFFGAICRFAVSGFMAERLGNGFPFGTLIVNLAGSFLLGLLVGSGFGAHTYNLVGTGFIGAFTTFSTFSLEGLTLARNRRWFAFFANLLITLAVGFLFAYTGYRIAVHH